MKFIILTTLGSFLVTALITYSAAMIKLSLVFPEVWLLVALTLPVPWIAIIKVAHQEVFE